MKTLFTMTSIFFMLVNTPSAQAQSDVSGSYTITRGVNTDNGDEYKGKVSLQLQGANVYHAFWDAGEDSEYQGVGFRVGNILGLGWSPNPNYGLTIYRVDGGRLRGTWFSNSTVKVHGREILKGSPELHGTYEIVEAYGADGGPEYSGTVGIRKLDDVYHLTWWIGNETFTGVGLLKGDLFIVGWSSGILDGVTYYEIKGNELLGRWATSNDTTSGVENLMRTK
jgi:hypothetical protein